MLENGQLELYDPLNISLDFYEGPLDLLLDLILSVLLKSVNPISRRSRTQPTHDLEMAGEFMVIASTLIYIKSREMLPPAPDEHDDSEEGENPEEALRRQLIEYTQYREIAERFDRREILTREVFARPEITEVSADAAIDVQYYNLTTYELIKTFSAVMRRAVRIKPYEIIKENLTLESSIRGLCSALLPYTDGQNPAEFQKITEDILHSGLLFVLSFFALLELSRTGLVHVYQMQEYGVIYIKPELKLADYLENGGTVIAELI
ncbi:hypothetical protein CHS0354_001970 [Potamilus streckersoni]|uniref:Segregation/condensation protein A n=1 Tax=Potamilus streckersoni TaxID=2493646 RepID=A0AAE0T6N8_9BIVA|nr:hypothetical protein CHS0354_001970 [Potamilus streckersoni]